MGKKAKEHRAKVAKRNQRIAEEKGKMQRAFNKLLKEQMDKFKEAEDLQVQVGDNPVEFSVVDPNEIETTDVVETLIEVDGDTELTTIKDTVISEDEEQ